MANDGTSISFCGDLISDHHDRKWVWHDPHHDFLCSEVVNANVNKVAVVEFKGGRSYSLAFKLFIVTC